MPPPNNLEALRQEYIRILKGGGRIRLGAKSIRTLKRMLDQPELTAVHSITALADDFNVSRSSITRLAQRLGYSGFPGLQDVFRKEIQTRKGFYSEQVERFLRRNPTNSIGVTEQSLQVSAKAEWENMLTAIERFDLAQYMKTISYILEGENIYILGLRGSYPLAYYFAYYLKMICRKVSLLGNPGGILAEGLVTAKEGDALLAVGVHPYTKLTVDACRFARKKGVNVAVLTDSRSSPLANEADAFLLLSPKTDSFFDSITAGAMYVNAILSEVVRRLGDTAIERLRQNETALSEFGIEMD